MSERKGAAPEIWRPKTKILNRVLMGLTLLGLGQWAFYGIFRCPFIVPYVQCENCPVISCHGRIFNLFWGFWGGLFLLTIVFGRAFCGWLSPGGTVNRLLGSFLKFRFKAGGLAERALPWGKYLALAISLYFVFMILQPRVNIPIRVGEFFMAVRQTFEFAEPVWIARTLLVLAIVALGIIIPAAWCKYACPTGGLLELTGCRSLFKVFKTSQCNGCDKCRQACYLNTRPEESNCTNCGDCIQPCPQECIGLGRNQES